MHFFMCMCQSWSETVNSRTHRRTFRFISILHEWQKNIKNCKLFTESILGIYCLSKYLHVYIFVIQTDSILINCIVILKQIYGSKIAFQLYKAWGEINFNSKSTFFLASVAKRDFKWFADIKIPHSPTSSAFFFIFCATFLDLIKIMKISMNFDRRRNPDARTHYHCSCAVSLHARGVFLLNQRNRSSFSRTKNFFAGSTSCFSHCYFLIKHQPSAYLVFFIFGIVIGQQAELF